MAALDEAHVEKKLLNLNNTQESIQSLSLWAIHHKTHHEKLVDIWFRVLKKCGINQRLNLFYLCNDIVQTCKRKHAIIYKDAFREILKDAILLVRDNSIRSSIERIISIWEERDVYDSEFLEELMTILNNTKAKSTGNFRSLAEFQPQLLVDKIRYCRKQQESLEIKRQQLQHLKIDVTSVESVKQIKDRIHSKEFMKQFEDSCTKLEDVLSLLGVMVKEREKLIELLEQSELYYDTQYGEAKVVTNAYKIFGSRVSNLQKKLLDYRSTLPDDGNSPIPSPPPDAPSPGDSPVVGDNANDNNQAIDMEMSDEEKDTHADLENSKDKTNDDQPTSNNISSKVAPPIKPDKPSGSIRPELDPRRNNVTTSTSSLTSVTTTWDSKLSALRPKEKTVIEPVNILFGLSQTSSVEGSMLPGLGGDTGGSTPVKDEHEGGGTPVLDEKVEESDAVGGGKALSNPIEFLSQLISQAPKPTSNTSTSGLLQTLFNIVGVVPSSSSQVPKSEELITTTQSINVISTPVATAWSQASPFTPVSDQYSTVSAYQQPAQYASLQSQPVPMPPLPPMPNYPSGPQNAPLPQLPPHPPYEQQSTPAPYAPLPPVGAAAPSYTPYYQTPAATFNMSAPLPAIDNNNAALAHSEVQDNRPVYMSMDANRTDFQRDNFASGTGDMFRNTNSYAQSSIKSVDVYEQEFTEEEHYGDMEQSSYKSNAMSQKRRASFNSSNLRTLTGGETDDGMDMSYGNDTNSGNDEYEHQGYYQNDGGRPSLLPRNTAVRMRGPRPPFYPRGGGPRFEGPRFDGPRHSMPYRSRFEHYGDERFDSGSFPNRFGPPPSKRQFQHPHGFDDNNEGYSQFY